MEGFRKNSQPMPQFFAITARIRPVAAAALAQPVPEIAQRTDHSAGAIFRSGHRFHLTHRGPGNQEVQFRHVHFGFVSFECHSTGEGSCIVEVVAEFKQNVGRACAPAETHLPGTQFVLRADLPPHVPVQRAPALFVGGPVEQRFAGIRHQRDLDGVQHRRFSAAVIAHQQAVCRDGENLILEVIPLHQPNGFQPPHSPDSSSCS